MSRDGPDQPLASEEDDDDIARGSRGCQCGQRAPDIAQCRVFIDQQASAGCLDPPKHLETRDVRHVYIRPRTPHLNGKVERSHRVDDQEFYQLLDQDGITDDIHLFNEKLREWEDYYNHHRPHGALNGQTPFERLMAKTRADVLPKV